MFQQIPTMFQSAIKLNNIGVSLIERQVQSVGFKEISESLKLLKTSRCTCSVEVPLVSCTIEAYSTHLSDSSVAPSDPQNETETATEVSVGFISHANMKKLLLTTTVHAPNSSLIRIVEYEHLCCNDHFHVIVSIAFYNLGKCLLVMAKKSPTNMTLWEQTFRMLQCGLDTLFQSEQSPMDEVQQTVVLILKAQILGNLCSVANQTSTTETASRFTMLPFLKLLRSWKPRYQR